jgi:hypothetical protein
MRLMWKYKQRARKMLHILPLFWSLMSDFCHPSSAVDNTNLWVYVTISDPGMRRVDSVRFTEITLRWGTTSVTLGTCGM